MSYFTWKERMALDAGQRWYECPPPDEDEDSDTEPYEPDGEEAKFDRDYGYIDNWY